MYAHYFATKTIKFVLITHTVHPYSNGAVRVEVKGKAEAREVAKRNNAQCWNF